MERVLAWAKGAVGKRLTAPGGAGGQCVDLANLWLLAASGHVVRANAADWAGAVVPGWRWVQNTPLNAPGTGDIVVWHANVPERGIGPYGHIAVALAADTFTLLSIDQDWPPGNPADLVWHDYEGVHGWWTPAVMVK